LPDNRKKTALFLAVIVILFLYGVTKLLSLRFEEGDVYPAYSSLRYDPLGARAFYEGLETLFKNSIKRNYDSLLRLDAGQKTALIYLGAREKDRVLSDKKHSKALKRLAAAGGRVVISLFPISKTKRLKKPTKDVKNDGKGASSDKLKGRKPKDKAPINAGEKKKVTTKNKWPGKSKIFKADPKESWDFRFGYEKNRDISVDAEFVSGSLKNILLPSVSWHTTLFFSDLGKEWKVIYTRNAHPVIIERNFGRGSVVLSADSYFFSNEALLKERRPELLSWIIGDCKKVIFDESHLGIRKNLGIATLGRKYNLHWLFLALLLFGVLFVWKNSVYFVPPPEKDLEEGLEESGNSKDYKEGLISLLRRNIRSDQIVGVCAESWEKSSSGSKGRPNATAETLSKVKKIIESERQRPGRQSNPVKVYQEICNILSKRKTL
jgi:hypothetical protein